MTWVILPAFSGAFLAPLSVLIRPNSPGVTLYVSWPGFQDPARSSDKPRKSIFNYMFGKTHKQFRLVWHWGKRSMWNFHRLNLLFGNFIHVDNTFGLPSLPSPLPSHSPHLLSPSHWHHPPSLYKILPHVPVFVLFGDVNQGNLYGHRFGNLPWILVGSLLGT